MDDKMDVYINNFRGKEGLYTNVLIDGEKHILKNKTIEDIVDYIEELDMKYASYDLDIDYNIEYGSLNDILYDYLKREGFEVTKVENLFIK